MRNVLWISISLATMMVGVAIGRVTAVEARQTTADVETLINHHRDSRRAHFDRDIDLLLRNSADRGIEVSRGSVMRITPAASRRFFQEYFRDAVYRKWDDLEEPIVRMSRDGMMAWMVTRLRVERVAKAADGNAREQRFDYAGLTVFEKIDGRWIRVANASTFAE